MSKIYAFDYLENGLQYSACAYFPGNFIQISMKWSVLFILLVLSLPMHLFIGFPDYARSEYLRPLYESMCSVLNCSLPLLKKTSAIELKEMRVRYLEEEKFVPVLQFSLVNRANYHNTYPRCRLVFKDLDGVELSDFEFHSKGFSMNHREYEGMPVGIPV